MAHESGSPAVFWVTPETVRFSFREEISRDNSRLLRAFDRILQQYFRCYFKETVAGYHTLTVYLKTPHGLPVAQLLTCWAQEGQHTAEFPSAAVTIPVCYDEEFAVDMERIMAYTKLSYKEIVAIHSTTVYEVFVVGFLPGFPYLGVLDPRLQVPRLAKARQQVAAGSVGIGGSQTGIYPLDSPGGWNILGRTPLPLFDAGTAPHFFFRPQTAVHIEKISKAQYLKMQEGGVKLWNDYLPL